MAYCTNPVVEYLLRHSYGQGGTVAVPTLDTGGPSTALAEIKGKFPAGVQDVLNRLVDVYAAWQPSVVGAPLEWCFLVGGPGNGKSEALRALSGALQVTLPARQAGQPAPRTVPETWPGQGAEVVPGLQIAFVNDASVPRMDAVGERRTGSLFLDVRDGVQKLFSVDAALVMFANVNRGILVEECRALEIAGGAGVPSSAAAEIIRWLADPRGTGSPPRNHVRPTVPVSPASPFYGQLAVSLKEHGAGHDIIVHAVFLDALSLLEPTPGPSARSIDFTTSPATPARYEPLGGLSDNISSRADTIGGDLAQTVVAEEKWNGGGCRTPGSTSPCEAYEYCPFAQNARWLRHGRLGDRFLDILRAAELAGGRRLTYRDLLGHLGLALVGTPEPSWLTNEHPCRWVERKVREASSGNSQSIAELVSHRIYANLFPVTDTIAWPRRRPLTEPRAYRVVATTMRGVHDAPRVRAFEQAFNLIDPARDVDSWDGIRAKILDMVEAMDVAPPAAEITTLQGWIDEASSQIEERLDAVVPGEIVKELGESAEAVARAQLVRKWRAVLLLRQAGLALGWLPHKGVIQGWLREHQAALSNRPSGSLRVGLNNLVLPGKNELNLAPFRPRTVELGSTLPANCVVVSLLERDVRLELVADGDTLSAELRLTSTGGATRIVARLPIDLKVAREALLNFDGSSGSFTEIGEAAFARIERARAALVSERYLGSARLLFSDTSGQPWEIVPQSSGPAPFRVQPGAAR
ncbi:MULTISPECIES: hypothetical protein [unclassified Bradyrhizobium]|uniref:hypothetical protein n=1 Tax=unclassified Bradyrhizobium TaxID=2631580 RepID=UPI002915F4A6|nr:MULTISPECIES: hypothetical protein [unclassified Bradyrhizobium]